MSNNPQMIERDDAEGRLQQATETLGLIDRPSEHVPPGLEPFELRDLSGCPPSTDEASVDRMHDADLDLNIEWGRTQLRRQDVLQLCSGSVVPLDKPAGDPVDVYVNGRLVARGEVLVLNDNFCVRVTELISGSALP